jgi:hypothetical protein
MIVARDDERTVSPDTDIVVALPLLILNECTSSIGLLLGYEHEDIERFLTPRGL